MILSLMDAISQDRLDDFIDQEEKRGVRPVFEAEFDEIASTVIKTPQLDDQTSHSPRRGGSREK